MLYEVFFAPGLAWAKPRRDRLLIRRLSKTPQEQRDGYHTMIAGIDAANQKICEFHKKLGFF